MLRILGSKRRLCDGLTRRDMMQVGALATGGLGLSSLLRAEAKASSGAGKHRFGQAKNCIILFLYGSPSQLETFDMKPQAPIEVRGTIEPIPSSLPGLPISELLPQTARIMDRVSVIRSVTHPYPLHGVANATTGVAAIDVGMELNPRDERHQPYFGSCVDYLDRRHGRGSTGTPLNNIALPFPFSSKRSDQPFRAGPYPAYLGEAFAPVWTEFVGEGTKVIRKERANGEFVFEGPEPYLGCSPDTHFRLAAMGRLPDLTLDRLQRRRSLLQQFDQARSAYDLSEVESNLDKFQEMAFSVISSPVVRDALDIRAESDSLKDRYGRTLFGQSCLAARRLVEAGTRVVSVFWDEYGLAGDAWDTHWGHFPRMKEQLCPGLDPALYGLITDLDDRGMLDETLVVLISEHGRTPKLKTGQGGGRDHWSRAYSVLFAGGGVKRGFVLGATDDIAGDVVDRPVSPKSLLATMYHLLGIDPTETLPGGDGRPAPLVPEGSEVIEELIA